MRRRGFLTGHVDVKAGYWVALFFVGAAGIHLLVVRFAERRRRRRRIWPSVAGAVLMALPTVLFVRAAGAS